MSTDPTAEHIDAVMATFASDLDRCGVVAWTNEYVGRTVAKIILTSTDPAVHSALAASLPAEAMLAALVDRGALKPEAHCAHARAAQADGDYRTYTCADVDASCPPDRLVTPWEVAP